MDNVVSFGSDARDLQIDRELLDQIVIYRNLHQEIIITTTDKLKLWWNEHESYRSTKPDLSRSLGTTTSLGAALFTADFRDLALFPSVSLKLLFTLALLVSLTWFIYDISKSLKHQKYDCDDFINDLQGPNQK